MEKFLKPIFKKIIKNEEQKNNPNIAVFTLEKLERGFGNTIGVALRRTILSSIPGAAPFAINLEGVNHEFQAFSDTYEDVVEIVLNLKNLIIEVDQDLIDIDEIYKFNINQREKIITAADIEVPAGFKITNKDLVIANMIPKAKMSMTIYVAYSKGFKTFEENRLFIKEKLGGISNIIAIDSNFSPIERVNIRISDVNPGESRVFERLTLEVETKGNILPEKVVAAAGSILENYFKSFAELHEIDLTKSFIEEVEEEETDSQLQASIETLNLSVRSENALKAADISTIEELIDRPVSALQTIKNLGDKSKNEIIQSVQDLGLSFKSE
ncbi:MAG: DNA-directed RNA polymerase subunit alpha [Candidatus Hepatoplasma scabrum]|nr:MAG: DNA-directed RNA polymerase subunit alpha [Candidatus Hepatoplasma sp.]